MVRGWNLDQDALQGLYCHFHSNNPLRPKARLGEFRQTVNPACLQARPIKSAVCSSNAPGKQSSIPCSSKLPDEPAIREVANLFLVCSKVAPTRFSSLSAVPTTARCLPLSVLAQLRIRNLVRPAPCCAALLVKKCGDLKSWRFKRGISRFRTGQT